MITKQLIYVSPSMKIISLDANQSILVGSPGGTEGGGSQVQNGVNASSWASGNEDWLSPQKDEGSIWK